MSYSMQSQRGSVWKPLIVIGAVITAILIATLIKIRTVEGNEIGVLETWSEGVVNDPLQPKTYIFLPGFNKSVYTYPTGGRVFVMNDKSDNEEHFAEGRRSDALQVNSLDNQKVNFHVTLTWRVDPTKVVQMHKNYRDNVEERLIRAEIVDAVGRRATLQNAIDLYSGQKLNDLRDSVTKELKSPDGKLAQSGVVVDKFVIEKPKLNPDYEKVIESRQLAIAQESQAKEQQKANLAIAEAAKTAALKQQYEQVVAAETAKKQQILQQEAASEQAIIKAKADAANLIVTQEAQARKTIIDAEAQAKQVALAAEAEKSRNVLIAQGEKEAGLARASAIEAIGQAEATALKLKLSAYATAGADGYVKIQVAQSMAQAFMNVKGFLPEKMSFNLLADQYNKGVNVLVNGSQAEGK